MRCSRRGSVCRPWSWTARVPARWAGANHMTPGSLSSEWASIMFSAHWFAVCYVLSRKVNRAKSLPLKFFQGEKLLGVNMFRAAVSTLGLFMCLEEWAWVHSNYGLLSKWNSCCCHGAKINVACRSLAWTFICIHFKSWTEICILLDIFSLLIFPKKSQ